MRWVYLTTGFLVVYIMTSIALQGANPFAIFANSLVIFLTLWIVLRYAVLSVGAYASPIPELPGEDNLIYNARADLAYNNKLLEHRLLDCIEDKKHLENKVQQIPNMIDPNIDYAFNVVNNVDGAQYEFQKGVARTHPTNEMRDYLIDNAKQGAFMFGNGLLNAGAAIGGKVGEAGEHVIKDVYGMGMDVAGGAIKNRYGLNENKNNRKGKRGGKNNHIGKGKGGPNNMGWKNDGVPARKAGRPKGPPKPKKPRGRPGPKPRNEKGELMVFDPVQGKYVDP